MIAAVVRHVGMDITQMHALTPLAATSPGTLLLTLGAAAGGIVVVTLLGLLMRRRARRAATVGRHRA